MNNSITITLGKKTYKFFLQAGFYINQLPPASLHSHKYTEIHVFSSPNITFFLDDKKFSSSSGNVLIIPGGVFHTFSEPADNKFHAAFQVDYPAEKCALYSLSDSIINTFFDEKALCAQTNDHSRIVSYLSLFASYIDQSNFVKAQPLTDYAFLIHEFFSSFYSKDVHLCDLAEFLHLSPRQAERLVIKYTSNTFNKHLTKTRMGYAKRLLEKNELSANEIAARIGYQSYSGFWKAFKKFNEKK